MNVDKAAAKRETKYPSGNEGRRHPGLRHPGYFTPEAVARRRRLRAEAELPLRS